MSCSPRFDSRDVADVADLLAAGSPCSVTLTPIEAFTAAGLIQAGCRSADPDTEILRRAHAIVARLKHGLPGELHEIVENGWDRFRGPEPTE